VLVDAATEAEVLIPVPGEAEAVGVEPIGIEAVGVADVLGVAAPGDHPRGCCPGVCRA
jgi:hypothetical protein